MYIYLDESGDLGFDFNKRATTDYFVVTLLLVRNKQNKIKIDKAVERTLKNKINVGKRAKKPENELKGTKTSLGVKEYFYRQIEKAEFEIYTIALNKRRVFKYLQENHERLYNYVARLVIDQIPFRGAKAKIVLSLDKSKSRKEIKEFNRYLFNQLEGVLPLKIPLEIYHLASYESKGVQAADLFCWGVFRKYERGDTKWYKVFKEKIRFKGVYLP